MTTNHKITVPTHAMEQLKRDTVTITGLRASGVYLTYPMFVHSLMKGMPTPAEELHHACTGMSGEAGELLDQSKKVWVYGKPLDLKHLIEELGDLRFYYQATLNMLGITDEDIQAQNTMKLQLRYPNGVYSDAQAQARADKVPGAGRNFIGQPDPMKDPPLNPFAWEARERTPAIPQTNTPILEQLTGVPDPLGTGPLEPETK